MKFYVNGVGFKICKANNIKNKRQAYKEVTKFIFFWYFDIFRTICDTENVAEKILFNMNPKQLIDVACKAYHQGNYYY